MEMESETGENSGSIENEGYQTLPQSAFPDDWMYTMRRTMQEIIPGLFLGPYGTATKNSLESMKAAGLTHVVCVRSKIEEHVIRANHKDHFNYLVVQMEDSPLEPIIPKVKTASLFIENCFSCGGKVLVHGNTGQSRSAALVVGYIMSAYGVAFKKANEYVQSKRFCISISDSYANLLKEYEPIYRAMHSTQRQLPGEDGDCYSANRMPKRKVEVISEDDAGGVGENNNHLEHGRPRMERRSEQMMELE